MSGVPAGRPTELAQQFAGLLWGDLMVSLLLGVAERPNPREIAGRARDAATAVIALCGTDPKNNSDYSRTTSPKAVERGTRGNFRPG